MARRYWVQVDGRKLYRDTLGAAKAHARQLADQLGRAVQVGYDDKPAAFKRNPDPGHFLDYWRESEKARQARRDYSNATKARRLAKSLRERRPAAVAHETAAAKSGKFLVTARNAKETLKLFRPSRTAAEALGAQFAAAGYKVTLNAV